MERLIGTFDTKKGHEQVRVYLAEDRKTLISVRMFKYRKDNWHQMNKSVSIPKSKIYRLIKLIEKAVDVVSSDSIQVVETQ
ncbi:MAG: hypothetical protein ACFFG0_22230 [Candidatus Thorarchaeota archaeon]